MIDIINIKKIGNIITANYIPEGSEVDIGYIELNCDTYEIIKSKITKWDGSLNGYLMRARLALIDMLKNNDIKGNTQIVWC